MINDVALLTIKDGRWRLQQYDRLFQFFERHGEVLHGRTHSTSRSVCWAAPVLMGRRLGEVWEWRITSAERAVSKELAELVLTPPLN
jgi:hypothetical protein